MTDPIEPPYHYPKIFKTLIWLFAGGLCYIGMDYVINGSVVSNALERYEVAKELEDQGAICNHIEKVIAAYVQVKDDTNAQKWEEKKKNECSGR